VTNNGGAAMSAGALLLQFWLSVAGGAALLLGAVGGGRAVALGCAVLGGILVWGAAGTTALHACVFAGSCSLLCECAFRYLPRCFTLGEGGFVSLGVTSVLHATVLAARAEASWGEPWSRGAVPLEILGVLCISTLLTAALFALLWPYFVDGRGSVRAPRVYCVMAACASAVYAPLLLPILERHRPDAVGLVPWLWRAVVESDHRQWIAIHWLCCIVRARLPPPAMWIWLLHHLRAANCPARSMQACVPCVPWLQAALGMPRIGARKLFHALALLMFAPAAASDNDFLALCLAVRGQLSSPPHVESPDRAPLPGRLPPSFSWCASTSASFGCRPLLQVCIVSCGTFWTRVTRGRLR